MKSYNKNSGNDYVVTRKLKTRHNPSNIERILKKIISTDSIINAKQNNNYISVTYDASTISLEEIIRTLTNHDIEIKRNTWINFLIGWYVFIDKNIQDNAKHKPHCCNKTPKI